MHHHDIRRSLKSCSAKTAEHDFGNLERPKAMFDKRCRENRGLANAAQIPPSAEILLASSLFTTVTVTPTTMLSTV